MVTGWWLCASEIISLSFQRPYLVHVTVPTLHIELVPVIGTSVGGSWGWVYANSTKVTKPGFKFKLTWCQSPGLHSTSLLPGNREAIPCLCYGRTSHKAALAWILTLCVWYLYVCGCTSIRVSRYSQIPRNPAPSLLVFCYSWMPDPYTLSVTWMVWQRGRGNVKVGRDAEDECQGSREEQADIATALHPEGMVLWSSPVW